MALGSRRIPALCSTPPAGTWASTGVPAGISERGPLRSLAPPFRPRSVSPGSRSGRPAAASRALARSLTAEVSVQSLGLDVFCGVDLPVVHRAASGAGPGPGPGRGRVPDQAAGGAGSGGGPIAVHHEEVLALPFQLVAQALPEHPVPGIQDVAPSQLSGHLRQGVGPHTHGVPSVGYPPGRLVDEVAPLVGDVLVEQAVSLHRLLEPGCIRSIRRCILASFSWERSSQWGGSAMAPSSAT